MKVRSAVFELPFVHPFTISKGTKTHQPILVVELEWNGLRGYGEAPAISYYGVTAGGMSEELDRKKSMVERFALTDPKRFWHFLHHLFPGNPFLVCALDMAGWDLYGKMRNAPLHRLVHADGSVSRVTDYTIGIDETGRMIEKMRERPWPVYKIKVGTEGDMERLRALRAHTDAPFRVDANAGWTLSEALEKIPQLAELGVEMVEQPLAKDDWTGMKRLFVESLIPLYADESCVGKGDVDACAGHFHGINIKLTKCGGITPALEMIETARKHGLGLMLGTMNESSLGTAAMAHLSPFFDLLDADGPLLLAEDIATGLDYAEGRLRIPDGPGLGVRLINPF
jgi:L-alanine-DL-glutamate epimerase-like enolase superfamily enzyme